MRAMVPTARALVGTVSGDERCGNYSLSVCNVSLDGLRAQIVRDILRTSQGLSSRFPCPAKSPELKVSPT